MAVVERERRGGQGMEGKTVVSAIRERFTYLYRVKDKRPKSTLRHYNHLQR